MKSFVCPNGRISKKIFLEEFRRHFKTHNCSQKHKHLIASRQELLEKTTIDIATMASNELHDPWCKAMLDCTACLREQRAEGADQCLAYLWILEQQLEKEGILVGGDSDDEDEKIPINYPLRWTQFCAKVQEFQDVEVAMAKGLAEAPKRIRYKNSIRLSGQRVLTRILTFQSEVFAMKATYIARNLNDWTSSALAYAKAIQTIHKALEVTDTAICKRWSRREMGMELIQSEEELLVEDADIVVVASKSLVDKRDKLLAQARREETKLVRKLTPQGKPRRRGRARYAATSG